MNIPTKPTEYTDEEILEMKEKELLSKDYLFVNTNFKRTTQPIFVLAMMENKRYIKMNMKELYFKDIDSKLNLISSFVKKHYKENNGKLEIWGNIQSYQYHINKEIYIFNSTGTIIKVELAKESIAIIKI